MILIFSLWQSWGSLIHPSLSGLDFMMIIAWLETFLTIVIDLIRLHSDRHNQIVKGLPLFRWIMRRHEESRFNTSTYYILSSAILVSGCRLGWWESKVIIMALVVLGFADPAASWIRYRIHLAKRGAKATRLAGLFVFLAVGSLMVWLADLAMAGHADFSRLFCAVAAAALSEAYGSEIVVLVRPLTKKFQEAVKHPATWWMTRLYFAEDNLVIPLMFALTATLVGF